MSTVDKSQIYECNQWLKRKYGSDGSGRANWRIVWSLDQTEKRLGDFVDKTPSGIIIREVREVREVYKYNWLPPCFVLECRAEFDGGGEVFNYNGYDIIFPFIDKNDQRVDPDLLSVQYMFEVLMLPLRKRKTHPDDIDKAHDKKFNQEVEEFEGILDE